MGKGIDIDNERVCILLYADDLVLLTENEKDLQFMLDALYGWCKNNNMYVNDNKSNIVLFRPPAVPKSEFVFKCGKKCGWLVGCFGLNGPLRQYFSLYRAISQREGERKEK